MADENVVDEELDEKHLDDIAVLIKDRFYDAKGARSANFFSGKSVESWLDESHERYMSNKCNEGFNLVRIKVDILHAKVKDMTIGSVDAPFIIKPTPIPELSPEQTESIQIDLQDKLSQVLLKEGIVIIEDDGTVKPRFDAVMDGHKLIPEASEWLQNEAKKQKKTQQFEAAKIAAEAGRNCTLRMQDQLYQGDWRGANLEADFDDYLYGTGCIKWEEKLVKTLKWKGGKLKEATDSRIVWRHVPIHNCYPSPDSQNAQKGTYFIELVGMSKQELWACSEISWFNQEKLEEAMDEAENNFAWLSENPENEAEHWNDEAMIDVIIHQGTVSASTLNDYFGYQKGDSNYKKTGTFYDIEAYMVADIVIGVRIMNHPFGKRTYYSSNYKQAGKNFWGIGIAMLLAHREDRLNFYESELKNNVNKTISPPTFYNSALFKRPSDIQTGFTDKGGLIPFETDPSLPNGVPQVPYYQVQFQSKTAELTSLFGRDYRLADDECGIPSLLSGNSNLVGGESTFRGMKLLAATSNIIIKSYFHNKEQTRIQPAMRDLWHYNMVNSDDESIKADVEVIARGTSGLMQKEIADAERMEMLPIITQLLQAAPISDEQKGDVISYLLREMMLAGGLPAQQLMDSPEVMAEQQSFVASLKPSTPMPTIGEDTNEGGLT